jgi:drug/metabolite transporter (DMT)-like permease
MWSSAFVSARIIVLEAPPLMALSLRFFVSGTVAVGIALLLKQSWQLSKSQWRATIVFGLCQNALYLGLNFIAMQTVQASIAAIIASTMPLLVALVGWLFLRQRLPLTALLGLVTGIVGVLVIMVPRLQVGLDPWGVLLCFLGAISLTVATLSVRNAVSSGQVLMIVGLQMLVGSAALTVPALLFETWNFTITPLLAGAFIYTTFVPGLAATVIWFVLVSQIGPVRASTLHFLNPFFGVVLAAIFLGEKIGLVDVLGVTVVAAGIFAVQVSK